MAIPPLPGAPAPRQMELGLGPDWALRGYGHHFAWIARANFSATRRTVQYLRRDGTISGPRDPETTLRGAEAIREAWANYLALCHDCEDYE